MLSKRCDMVCINRVNWRSNFANFSFKHFSDSSLTSFDRLCEVCNGSTGVSRSELWSCIDSPMATTHPHCINSTGKTRLILCFFSPKLFSALWKCINFGCYANGSNYPKCNKSQLRSRASAKRDKSRKVPSQPKIANLFSALSWRRDTQPLFRFGYRTHTQTHICSLNIVLINAITNIEMLSIPRIHQPKNFSRECWYRRRRRSPN